MLDGGIEILADIDAKNPPIANLAQIGEKCVDSLIVESHAIDDGLVFRQAE